MHNKTGFIGQLFLTLWRGQPYVTPLPKHFKILVVIFARLRTNHIRTSTLIRLGQSEILVSPPSLHY